jgi:hypothetical protein
VRRLGVLALVVVAVGCDAGVRPAARVPATGPPGTIRVAVERLDDPSVQGAFGGLRPRFRLVSADAARIVGARRGLRVEFVRMEAHRAAVAFRRGQVDVAPVALGDIRAAQLDSSLRGSVRVRPLLAVDLVRLDRPIPLQVRRFLWLAAGREDYRALVPERAAPAAYGLLPDAAPVKRPSLRELRRQADELPPTRVRLRAGYEAELLAAFWREAGADVVVVREPPFDARFERVAARFPAERWLFAAALGPRSARGRLGALDRRLRSDATIVPIAWVAGAKLVSRRLSGWRQDELGTTDYALVRIRPPGRRP